VHRLLLAAPTPARFFLLRIAFSAIASNFDYGRKEQLLEFYHRVILSLAEEGLGLPELPRLKAAL